MTLPQSIAHLNRNNQALQTTLKAVGGDARGYFTEPDGRVRRFDVDAKLLIRPPRCLRLELTTLGSSLLTLGSNPERYWLESPDTDTLSWGRYDLASPSRSAALLIRPDLLVESLGIRMIPRGASSDRGPFLRNTPDHQQLIFTDYDDDLNGFVSKEYWIDRYDHQLINRIVFRDPAGGLIMDARLSRHRAVTADGPLVPHRIEAEWPSTKSALTFTCRRWDRMPAVGENHPAFQWPPDRGATFDRIIDIDGPPLTTTELEAATTPDPIR